MPTEIIVRRAVDGDSAALSALFAELDEFHRSARPDLFRVPDGPVRDAAYLKGLIDGSDSVVFIAEDDKALLGLSVVIVRRWTESAFRPQRSWAEIDSFGLTVRARRQGIGRRLMLASEDWARARGETKLELQVHAFNAGAIAFYEVDGFKPMMFRMERSLT